MTTGGAASADDVIRQLFGTAASLADPYPLYHRLRQLAPVHRSELDGSVYLTRYDDCRQVLLDPRCGRRPGRPAQRVGMADSQVRLLARRRRQQHSMLMQNPPDHTRLRGLVSGAFTPQRTAALDGRIRQLVGEHVDRMAEAGEVDVMQALAFPVPVIVIGELLGIPKGEALRFRPLVETIRRAEQPHAAGDVVADAERADQAIDEYFADLVARRRERAGDDLLSALVAVRDGGGPLSEEELTGAVTQLFVAGFVTTTNLIGNGLLALARHPAEFARLRLDPGLIAPAVEEMLRYDSPVQVNDRVVLEPAEVAGVSLDRGDNLTIIMGAANRDPGRFDDPDRFDVSRRDNQTLSFGWGIHHCVGAGLARLEGQIVFGRLTERFTAAELLEDEPPRQPGFFLRGLQRLPVRLRSR
jgi:cytochrome P450